MIHEFSAVGTSLSLRLYTGIFPISLKKANQYIYRIRDPVASRMNP